jgi:uncharacterized membrane protein
MNREAQQETTMLPDPLHPALVHFPIVLALLAPLLAAGFFWAIRTGRFPARAWIAVVVFQAVLFGSAWLTAETGEEEEERVERVVAEDPIEEHEEAAEWFIWITAVTLPFAAAGVLSGGPATGARVLTIVGTLVAAAAVAQVGHTGGLLVYEHGAALAYLDGPAAAKAFGRKAIERLIDEATAGGTGRQERDGGDGNRGERP